MDRRKLLLVVAAVVAALGVALVFAYARGAETRAAEKYDTVQVLTASQEIAPGESLDTAIDNGKVQLTYVAQTQVLDGASSSADALRGQVALTTIYAGEQLIPVKFGAADEVEAAATLPIPAGKLAISVSFEDAARVGDFISPGAQISVLLTQDGSSSRVLLKRVTVLGSGTRTTLPSDETGTQTSDDLGSLLTVAVTQKEAEKVRLAETIGSLSVALLNDGSKVKTDQGVDNSNVFE